MKRDTLEFIKELAVNNNREWFQENKARYESAKADVMSLTANMIKRIGAWDEEIRFLDAKECLFRIFRDVRFSPDKAPYKRHFGTYIAKNGGHRSIYSGYYIHIEPGNCMLSGGLWCPDSETVKKMRSIIDADWEELKEIVEDKQFRKFFGTQLVSINPPLKRMPRGYDENHPAAEWLRMKELLASWHFEDEILFAEDFEERLEEGCKALCKFSKWCNSVLEY